MPTPKQVRSHYKSVRYFSYHLRRALSSAHEARVIVYDDYNKGPIAALMEVMNRIETTTKDARAQAMKDEVMKELKGMY